MSAAEEFVRRAMTGEPMPRLGYTGSSPAHGVRPARSTVQAPARPEGGGRPSVQDHPPFQLNQYFGGGAPDAGGHAAGGGKAKDGGDKGGIHVTQKGEQHQGGSSREEGFYPAYNRLVNVAITPFSEWQGGTNADIRKMGGLGKTISRTLLVIGTGLQGLAIGAGVGLNVAGLGIPGVAWMLGLGAVGVGIGPLTLPVLGLYLIGKGISFNVATFARMRSKERKHNWQIWRAKKNP